MIEKVMLGLAMTLLTAGVAFGAHPLITDDTGTQGKGNFQLEVNSEFAHEDEDGATENSMEVATILSCGIADTVDIVLGAPYQWLRVKEDGDTVLKESGLSDMTVEMKWRFLEREKFSLALKPGISLPTGDAEKGLGSGKVAYSVFLISTYEVQPLAIHANLGYIRNENDADEQKNLWHASVAAGYSVSGKLTIVGNIGIERNTDRNIDTHPAFILGGLIYSIREYLDIDFGVKGGLNEPDTDYSILAGLAWRF